MGNEKKCKFVHSSLMACVFGFSAPPGLDFGPSLALVQLWFPFESSWGSTWVECHFVFILDDLKLLCSFPSVKPKTRNVLLLIITVLLPSFLNL